MSYGKQINIKLSGNSSGEHSCSQHANCMVPQNLRHMWHCIMCTFQWPLIFPSTRCICVLIRLFNPLLDIPPHPTFLGSFVSAHETWDQHFTFCVYVFVQCIYLPHTSSSFEIPAIFFNKKKVGNLYRERCCGLFRILCCVMLSICPYGNLFHRENT